MNLFKYLKGYRLTAALGGFFKFLEAILQLFIPISFTMMMREAPLAIQFWDFRIWKYFIAIVVCVVVSYVFSCLGQLFAHKVGAGVASNIRLDLYKHIATFSFPELDKFGVASLNNRATKDISSMQDAVSRTVRIALRIPAVFFGCLVVLFLIDWSVALIIVALVPIIVLILVLLFKFFKKGYPKIALSRDKITTVTRENVRGARIVRAFTNEKLEESRFVARNKEYAIAVHNLAKVSSVIQPLVGFFIGLTLVAMYLVSGYDMELGIIDPTLLPILTSYTHELVSFMVMVIDFVIILGAGRASWLRIKEVMNLHASITSPENACFYNTDGNNAIEFVDVSFVYPNGDVALRDISFRIGAKERIGITGFTGSGKTSLVNLIPRFCDTSGGKILLNGVDVRDYDLSSLRQAIAFVSQTTDMISGTIAQNLQFDGEHTKEEMYEALRVADGLNVLEAKPGGLSEVVLAEGRNFSLGQQQRISVARGIIMQRGVLIFDDSFSALDNITENKIQREIMKTDYDPILITVSQKVSTLKTMDRIILLDKGSVSMIGAHEELVKKSPLYRKIVISQEGDDSNA